MTKTINYQQLVELDACLEGLERFEAAFGKEADVPVTVENCERMYFIDVEWLSRIILKPSIFDACMVPMCAEYGRDHALILSEYRRALKPVWDDYERAHRSIRDGHISAYTATIRAEYERACEPIRAECKRAIKLVEDKHHRDFIIKFCEVFNNEGIENNDQNN